MIKLSLRERNKINATVAQSVEQLIRNQQVAGSSPASSSKIKQPKIGCFIFILQYVWQTLLVNVKMNYTCGRSSFSLFFKLIFVQIRINAALRKQLLVRAALGDFPFGQYENFIRILHRRKSMRYHQGCPAYRQF